MNSHNIPQGLVVQKVNNSIHWINLYSEENCDLSSGKRYPTVKKTGPDGQLAFRLGRGNSQIPGDSTFSEKRILLGVRFCFFLGTKSHNGTETETPSLALGICEFHQSYF